MRGADLEKGTAENPGSVGAVVVEEAAYEEDEKKSVREVLVSDENILGDQPSRDSSRTTDPADFKSEV